MVKELKQHWFFKGELHTTEYFTYLDQYGVLWCVSKAIHTNGAKTYFLSNEAVPFAMSCNQKVARDIFNEVSEKWHKSHVV